MAVCYACLQFESLRIKVRASLVHRLQIFHFSAEAPLHLWIHSLLCFHFNVRPQNLGKYQF